MAHFTAEAPSAGPSPIVPGRVPESLRHDFLAEAERRGLTPSRALREAISSWVYGEPDAREAA